MDYLIFYDDIDMDKFKESLDKYPNEFGNNLQFSFIKKPTDYSKGMESNEEEITSSSSEQTILSSSISADEISHKLFEFITTSFKNNADYRDLSAMTMNSISWLLQHKDLMNYTTKSHLLKNWSSY